MQRLNPALGVWQLFRPGQIEASLCSEVAELPIWRIPGPTLRLLMIVGSDLAETSAACPRGGRWLSLCDDSQF